MSALIRALFVSRDGLSRVLTVVNPPPPTYLLPLDPRVGTADGGISAPGRRYRLVRVKDEQALYEEDGT